MRLDFCVKTCEFCREITSLPTILIHDIVSDAHAELSLNMKYQSAHTGFDINIFLVGTLRGNRGGTLKSLS